MMGRHTHTHTKNIFIVERDLSQECVVSYHDLYLKSYAAQYSCTFLYLFLSSTSLLVYTPTVLSDSKKESSL